MRMGFTGKPHSSPLVRELEELFKCRIDVQAGDGWAFSIIAAKGKQMNIPGGMTTCPQQFLLSV